MLSDQVYFYSSIITYYIRCCLALQLQGTIMIYPDFNKDNHTKPLIYISSSIHW